MHFPNTVKSFFISFTIFIFALPGLSQDVPANWTYRRLQTQHFDLFYAAKQKHQAELFGESLEKVHQQVAMWFSELPKRIVVVIQDKTDRTNGYATNLPYPHIVIYPVMPLPSETLGELGEWNMTLIGHEYTHIATFTPANGLMKAFRVVFGTVIAPNMFLPNWWKEGIAVDVESQVAGRGRSHSLYQEAMARSFGADLEKFSIAEANENLPTWPEGNRPYFLGSLFWAYASEEFGKSRHELLTQRHGRRVPYFIEEPANDLLQTDYDSFYQMALRHFRELADEQTRIISGVEITKEKPLLPSFRYSQYPAINNKGDKLAVLASDDKDKRRIEILDRLGDSFVDSKKSKATETGFDSHVDNMKEAPPSGAISRISWLNKSDVIVYDKITDFSYLESYSDLYLYNLDNQKTERLTFGARAREAAADPEDKKLVCVLLAASQTSLGLFDLKTKALSTVWNARFEERISHPVFLDETTILFSLTKKNGQEFLASFDLNHPSVEPKIILADFEPARFPLISNGNLYFISGKNRVWNLYRSDLSFKKITALSNTKTAYFQFTKLPDKEKIFVSSLQAQGPTVVSFDAIERKPEELPKPLPLLSKKYENAKGDVPTLELNKSEWRDEEYSPSSYLWPQYWVPFLASNSYGGLIYQAITSGYDPIKHHVYSAQLNWDAQLNKPSFAGTYMNSVWPWSWSITGVQSNSYLGSTVNTYTDTNWTANLYPDVFNVNANLRLTVGWKYYGRKFDSVEVKRTGPSVFASHVDYSKSGSEISPEEGHIFYVGATQYLKTSDYLNHSQYLLGATIYTSKFLPARHALMARAQAFLIPDRINAVYGAQTDSLQLLQDSAQISYLLRGYKTGQIYGRNLYSTNIEYRIPFVDINRGRGTDPYFFRRMFGVVTWDMASTDGYALPASQIYQPTSAETLYQSLGAEVHLETTLGYIVPINFVFGVYSPNPDLNKTGLSSAFSLQFSQLF